MGQKTVKRSTCPICKKQLMPWHRTTCKNAQCRERYFAICAKVKMNLRPVSDGSARPWSELVEEEYERNHSKSRSS